MTTLAPSAANNLAVVRPMPLLPPVTTATAPSSNLLTILAPFRGKRWSARNVHLFRIMEQLNSVKPSGSFEDGSIHSPRDGGHHARRRPRRARRPGAAGDRQGSNAKERLRVLHRSDALWPSSEIDPFAPFPHLAGIWLDPHHQEGRREQQRPAPDRYRG